MNNLIFCSECKHFRRGCWDYDVNDTCKHEKMYLYDPISLYEIEQDCIEKNKDNNCIFFELNFFQKIKNKNPWLGKIFKKWYIVCDEVEND